MQVLNCLLAQQVLRAFVNGVHSSQQIVVYIPALHGALRAKQKQNSRF